MIMQNGKSRVLGRVGAFLLLALLAARSLTAISPNDGPNRRQALREGWLRAMDAYALTYGGANWSFVGMSLARDPAGSTNPQVMSVFLSLGNVYLNRFEQRHSAEDLDQSMGFFEVVAGNEQLWGRRPFAGSVVAYLGVSLLRLEAECELGPYRGRVEDLRLRVNEVAAAEASAVADLEEYFGWLVATTPEEDAARAGLYSAAANLLPEDSRAGFWGQNARLVANRLWSVDSRSAETMLALRQAELLYELSGKEIPAEFEQFVSQRGVVVPFRDVSPIVFAQGIEPVVEPDFLETAVRESRAVAAVLSVYLRHFPPGWDCVITEEPDNGRTR